MAGNIAGGVVDNIADFIDPRVKTNNRLWAFGGVLVDVASGGEGRVLRGLIPTAKNYRTIFQKTFGVLAKDIQVHHTLPQVYEELFKSVGINIHEMKYLEAVPRKMHEKITATWSKWDKAQNGDITVEKVMKYADEIKKDFGEYFIPKN